MDALKHIVQPGETLSQIITLYGIEDIDALFDYPGNQSLWQQLASVSDLPVGTALYIPLNSITGHQVTADSDNVFVSQNHQQVTVKFKLKNEALEPLPNVNYTLIAGEQEFSGTTDGEGWVEQTIETAETGAVIKCAPYTEAPNLNLLFIISWKGLAPVDTSTGEKQYLQYTNCAPPLPAPDEIEEQSRLRFDYVSTTPAQQQFEEEKTYLS
jgi:hypothetical protein